MRDQKTRATLIEAVIAGGLIAVGVATGQPLVALASSVAGVGGNWAHSLAERGFQCWKPVEKTLLYLFKRRLLLESYTRMQPMTASAVCMSQQLTHFTPLCHALCLPHMQSRHLSLQPPGYRARCKSASHARRES